MPTGVYKRTREMYNSRRGKAPWNKNTKGIMKPNSGSFKKGNHPKTEFKKGQTLGANHPMWKDGRIKGFGGYMLILMPNHPFCQKCGYVYEHRLVIEKQIKRYLTPDEIGHHIGAIDDNRPHMLMAFSSISAHMRFHSNPDNVKPSEIIFDGRLL